MLSGPIKAVEALVEDTAFPAVPAGSLFPFAGQSIPEGWLPCDGSVVSLREYPRLAFLVRDWGRVGKDKVRIPDLRGKVPVGEIPGTWPPVPLYGTAQYIMKAG
jgi:microcystin-dependent protein